MKIRIFLIRSAGAGVEVGEGVVLGVGDAVAVAVVVGVADGGAVRVGEAVSVLASALVGDEARGTQPARKPAPAATKRWFRKSRRDSFRYNVLSSKAGAAARHLAGSADHLGYCANGRKR